MLNKSLLVLTVLAPLVLSTTGFAQTANAVDPTCMMKNADGTQVVDKAKCPDGTPKSSADTAKGADDAATNGASTAAGKAAVDPTTTASTAPAKIDILVSPDKMTGAKILSANDFIGQTVYSHADEKVGKVDDLILSENGVQAVVLGVGGFLGMGTKDVAVMLSSIEITKDGNAIKLVVDATKDQLKAAPTYDPKVRSYIN